jgi:hypothetical protein
MSSAPAPDDDGTTPVPVSKGRSYAVFCAQTYVDIRRLDTKIRSEMFHHADAWVRILLEVILQASKDVRSHLLALGNVLIRQEDGFLGAPRLVEDHCSCYPFTGRWQIVAGGS